MNASIIHPQGTTCGVGLNVHGIKIPARRRNRLQMSSQFKQHGICMIRMVDVTTVHAKQSSCIIVQG